MKMTVVPLELMDFIMKCIIDQDLAPTAYDGMVLGDETHRLLQVRECHY